jgi:hypothetical protein
MLTFNRHINCTMQHTGDQEQKQRGAQRLQQRICEQQEAQLSLQDAELKALRTRVEDLQRDKDLTSSQSAELQCCPPHKPQEDVFASDVLVTHILEFVGPNQYFFSASISRKCRQMQIVLSCKDSAKNGTKHKLRTSFTAALASPTRLSWAFECGLTQKAQFKRPVRLVQAAMLASDDPVSVLALLEAQNFKAKDADEGVKLCVAAVKKADLALLQWLREYDCPWNVHTCRLAALEGHLHILIWAHENGCKWDEGTCLSAALELWSLAHTAVGT